MNIPVRGWPGWKCFNYAWLNGRLAASVVVSCLICQIFDFKSRPFSCSNKVTRFDEATTRGTIKIRSRRAWSYIPPRAFFMSRLTGLKFVAHDWAHMERPQVYGVDIIKVRRKTAGIPASPFSLRLACVIASSTALKSTLFTSSSWSCPSWHSSSSLCEPTREGNGSYWGHFKDEVFR